MQTPKPRRRTWAVLALAVAALVAGALVFEPWKLVLDRTVDEAEPAAAVPAAGAPPGPVVLARGTLIAHEHASSGSVAVLRLADGSRVVRLQDLRTSDGPALRVWLADAPVVAGPGGWRVFDGGRHVDLGELKGNIGSSNYPLPADVDLAALPSLTIWCARFHVSFAAAALHPAG